MPGHDWLDPDPTDWLGASQAVASRLQSQQYTNPKKASSTNW